MKLLKRFGKHEAGEDIPANDVLKKHLIAGGFAAEDKPEVKKVAKKPKK